MRIGIDVGGTHTTNQVVLALGMLERKGMMGSNPQMLTKACQYLQKQREARDDIEASKMKIEWGSQIRNYVMHPYKLVKDVRTQHETGNVDAVMNGDIESFLKAYLMMTGQDELSADL